MKRFFCGILLTCTGLILLSASSLHERIYLQTDKHLYLAGEPVLMKLATTDQEQIPLVFSKVAYVELVSESVARLQIKVELTNGTGAGRMLLPTDLPTGYYRLIAYTQFMRNEGVGVFFEKNIAVLNTFQSDYYPAESGKSLDDVNPETSNPEPETISLQPNKTAYTTREHGELILTGLPENMHTLSVSVAGKEFVPVTASDVSLFGNNLMKKPAAFAGEFLPEYEGHIITGTMISNETGKPESGKTMLTPGISFPGEGIRFFSGQKTETGDICFFTSGISGTNEIATILYNADDKYRIDIQSPFVSEFAPEQMPSLHVDSTYYGQLLERSVALQVLHYFSDDPSVGSDVSEPFFKMKPSMSYPLEEYTRFTTMREVFTEFIAGARFRRNGDKQEISVLVKKGNYFEYGSMPLVLLDGVPISDHDVIFNYDPLAVEIINIYYGPCMMGGYRFDGIVELTTHHRLHQDLNLNRSTQIISYEGPQTYHMMDIPDYSDEENRRSRIPDGRHTLLWNPDVPTDGKTSIRLPFDTSDLTGEFQATVEGITKDGEIIFATSFFKVER